MTVYVVTFGADYDSDDVVRVASTLAGAKREGETYARAVLGRPDIEFDWIERRTSTADRCGVWAARVAGSLTLAVEEHEVLP